MALSNSLNLAIKNAAKFVVNVGSSKIESEHLLYGILTVTDDRATRLLLNVGVSLETYKNVLLRYQKSEGNLGIKEVSYSKSVAQILAKSSEFCAKNAINSVEIEVILYFMLSGAELKATKFLTSIFKIDVNQLKDKLIKLIGVNPVSSKENEKKSSIINNVSKLPDELENLGENLTEKISKKSDFKVIGRDEETSRIIEILCRKTKNNPILIGEPGVGKSSVVEGLAYRILMNDVPDAISGKTIFMLDLASLMSGTKFRGSMEEKLKNAINCLMGSDEFIVFIDEIHMLAEAGSKGGEISPADILKPYLARGELRVIGATTLDEYTKYIEKDPALERRFQPVRVDEPSAEDTIKILKGVRSSFENFHNVKISDSAIDAAVNLSIRYITNRFLPDKAIDLIDEACSKVRVNKSAMPEEVRELNLKISELEKQKQICIQRQDYQKAALIKAQKEQLILKIEQYKTSLYEKTGNTFGEITEDNIKEAISQWTKIPVTKLTSSEKEKLLNLEKILSNRVIGQSEAVSVVSKAIRRSRADINDSKRPIGSFLFLGPTGVGKTELTKALGDILFDSEDAVIRFDMSEFKESHSISRLIGAPPGYVGHEDGGELTEAVRKNPYSVVLFDEIEKAHPDIFNIMLQIFDDGRLTDSSGKLVNFKNTIIILTSNNGVQDLLARRKFEKEHPELKKVETQEFLMDKLRDNFKPELLNRIDSIVIFDSLSFESVRKISDIMLNSLIKRLEKKNISLQMTEEAKNLICKKGYDEVYGARPLRRVIDKEIKDILAEMIISGKLQDNSAIKVDAANNEFIFNILC